MTNKESLVVYSKGCEQERKTQVIRASFVDVVREL
jgi:hypothetical protein